MLRTAAKALIRKDRRFATKERGEK